VTANGCAVSSMLVPSCGVLWGSYSHPAGTENWTTAQTDLESQLGRKFDISYHYHDFSGPANQVNGMMPTTYEKSLAASGHVILDDWAPRIFSTGQKLMWADIAAGTYDSSVIIPVAQSIKAWGQPMMLSIDHEMDARVGTSGTAAEYVAMYRHIHDVFAAQGVTNVVFVWTTTGYSGRYSMFPQLYPGDAYVDWIGWDPYNFNTCLNSRGSWKTVQQTIDPMYQWLESNGFGNKPFILPEWGTVPDPNDSTAAANWYSHVPAVIASHPNIKATIQWNDSVGQCNVYLDAQPGEMAAFAATGRSAPVTGAS
jgi:glycosyl hydrolase family 26